VAKQYKKPNGTKSFKLLGDTWSNVDVEAFMNTMRGEDVAEIN
jgi:hypothetical protein